MSVDYPLQAALEVHFRPVKLHAEQRQSYRLPRKTKSTAKLFGKVALRVTLVKSRHAARGEDDGAGRSGKRQRRQKNKSYSVHV